MERVLGIEPRYSAWKADILPLNYTRIYFILMVGVTGIEPATSWSQTTRAPICATPRYGVPLGIRTPGPRLRRALLYPAELKIHILKHLCFMERVLGIEPRYSAWKADILPLNYTRIWSGRRDSNSQLSPWQGDTLPLSHFRVLFI